jgi:hypothetical protein
MPHVIYDVNEPTNFFEQSGSGFFEGTRYQRGFGYRRRGQVGRGVMGILTKAWKYLKPYITPIAKEALKALSDEGLERGQKVLSDISHGHSIQDTLAEQGAVALKNLAKKAGTKLTQAGSGRKKKVPRTLTNLQLIGQSVSERAAKKGRVNENFGLF